MKLPLVAVRPKIATFLVLAVVIAACGGGGGGPTASPTASQDVIIEPTPAGGSLLFANAFPGASPTEQLDAAVAACADRRCFIIAPPGLGGGAPTSMPENVTLIDMRQEAVRIIRRGHQLGNGDPQYFANEINHSTLVAADVVPPSADHEQDQAIAGLIDNYSPNLNAVGIWGGAASRAAGARAWGGFTSVTNTAGEDAQIIGLEVDTMNTSLPGVFPNHSKVGVQIVGIGFGEPDGDHRNTAAIEILSDKVGRWINAIVIDDGALDAESTIIGVGEKGPVRAGLDFSATTFTDAAIRIKNNQKIRLDTPSGSPAQIYSDDQPESALALVAGPGGIRLVDNSGARNLVLVSPDGTVSVDGPILEEGSRVNTRENTDMHFSAGTGMSRAPQPQVPFGATVFDSAVAVKRLTVALTRAATGGSEGTTWRVTNGASSLTLVTPPDAKPGDIFTAEGSVSFAEGEKVWVDILSSDATGRPGGNVTVEYVEQ
jgi:hypothetical protein